MNSIWALALVGAFILAGILFVLNKNKKPAPPKMREDYPHYVVIPCDGLPPTGRLHIEFDAIGPFASDATVTPYFQREGDDWLARRETEAYRWWASFTTQPLKPGHYTIDVPFDANWTAILHSTRDSNPQGYLDALKYAHKVGFTVGDVSGLGHGENPRGALQNVTIKIVA